MSRYVTWVSIQYLVRAEVPAAENGDPQHVPGPRDGAGDRVTEQVEGVRGGYPAVRAVQQLGGHGPGVQRVHLLYPANLVETWQRGKHILLAQRFLRDILSREYVRLQTHVWFCTFNFLIVHCLSIITSLEAIPYNFAGKTWLGKIENPRLSMVVFAIYVRGVIKKFVDCLHKIKTPKDKSMKD